MKYPKIETLYNRSQETFKVIPSQLRRPEFALVNCWLITEKIDGTNLRIMLFPDGHVEYRGRTDKAQFHPNLTAYLERTFLPENLRLVFNQAEDNSWPMTIIYGEGYGPKIQSGGKYRDDIAMRIFDVKVGEWWLNWDDVKEIATRFNVKTVPYLGLLKGFLPTHKDELLDILGSSIVTFLEKKSCVEAEAEGIVARTDPLLFNRRGNRVVWKLKFKDF